MENEPKQTTETGDNPIESILRIIDDNSKAIREVNDLCGQFEKISEKCLNEDEELQKLHEKYPSLEGWQLAFLKKDPKFANEFLPRYIKQRAEFAKKVEEYNKWLADITDVITEPYDGKAWADLLCEHPEFADKCDWSKLGPEDWDRLLAKRPEFAEFKPKN